MGELQTTDELEQMLRDTGGVLIELGFDETYGHFDIVDEAIISGAEVLVGVPSVVVPTGKLEKLAIGQQIIVDDVKYKVRHPQRIDEGLLTRVLLEEI